jgi:2-oxoglutarate-Fe(II)-dependent oxygenase superfamily protein
VRRVVTDRPREGPTRVNQPFSDGILGILDDVKRRVIFAELFGSTSQYFIRRCQAHRLVAGAHIGLHLDVESNPHNEFSAIVQFSEHFDGGEFVVHPEGSREQVFSPAYGSVLITTCRFQHEVRKVLRNERRSLVYFYSRHAGVNERDVSVRCSRPGCRWCGEHLRSQVDS